MIQLVTMYEAECDNCKKTWEDGHYGWCAMVDESSLKTCLDDCGWHTTDDDKTYCPDCFNWDDDDKLVLTPKPTNDNE